MEPAGKQEKTKYKLAASMKECMKQMPVDKITVKNIVEGCGVARQTFYRNFLDKYDLINWYFDKLVLQSFEQIGRNSYILVGVIEILRQNDVYLITTECDLNAELINSGLERFVGDRFTRASFGKPRFDVRLPLMDQF